MRAVLVCPGVSRQVVRDDLTVEALCQRLAELKFPAVCGVEVGLVVRPTAVEAVQVQPGSAKIHQRIDIVSLLQTAGRVKRNIVVYKLAQVGVAGIDGAVFLGVMQARGLAGFRRRNRQPGRRVISLRQG